jgi:hypothetical protein
MKMTALVFCLMSISGSFASAHDMANMKMPNMTTEQRQKMADAHEKMAACLRSDKDLKECHEAMMKSCQDTMGKDCPMGGGMHHHDHKTSDAKKSE